MATFRDQGTPLGGERAFTRELRDVRQRLFSPEHKQDDAEDFDIGTPVTSNAAGGVPVPETPTQAHGHAQENMMEALSTLLDNKLKPISDSNQLLQQRIEQVELTTKTNIENLQAQLKENEEMLSANIENVATDLRKLKESSAKHYEELNREIRQSEPMSRIQALERQLSELTRARGNSEKASDTAATTAVFGGLGGCGDKWEAESWLWKQLWYNNAPTATEFYAKGDFTGILFAKFASTVDRDDAVNKFRAAKLETGNGVAWAKADLPIDIRAPRGLLFGTKSLMIEWGFPRNTLWADPEEYTLQMGDDNIFEIKVEGGEMIVTYGNGWEEYLKNDTQWQELLKTHAGKLQKGKAAKGAGKGKAKNGKSGGSSR